MIGIVTHSSPGNNDAAGSGFRGIYSKYNSAAAFAQRKPLTVKVERLAGFGTQCLERLETGNHIFSCYISAGHNRVVKFSGSQQAAGFD